VYLLITVDTEEDNWDNYHRKPSVHNIAKIPELHRLLSKYGCKPTYLITYPVACDKTAISYLKPLLVDNGCEIGTHLHPWSTPPIEETICAKNSMLNNLPAELQCAKLTNLHSKIIDNFGVVPRVFRAGRYALNSDLARTLVGLGYEVESSITPFTDWTAFHGPDFSQCSILNPYRFRCGNLAEKDDQGELLQVPLSIGFLQSNFHLANFISVKLKRSPYKYLRLVGLLSHLNLLNKVNLSPEGYTVSEIKRLIQTMIRNGIKVFNLSFHSSTLLPGSTPFVQTIEDYDLFLKKIEDILVYMKTLNAEPITLSEVPTKIYTD